MGLIVGIVFEVLGIVLLANYLLFNSSAFLLSSIGLIVVGVMFLVKSIPAFIPIRQQTAIPKSCQYCGAIIEIDSTVCEKCKQQLD
jgi:hypothetical protein